MPSNKSIECLFSLLKLSFWNDGQLDIPEGTDWVEIIDLSFKHGVAALAVSGIQKVYDKYPDLELSLDTPEYEDLKFEWFGELLSSESNYTALNEDIIRLDAGLRKIGIAPVLLKGQGLASYYPVPALRQCGDIDMYVGEVDYDAAKNYIFSLATHEEIANHREVYKELNIKLGETTFELHKYCAVISDDKINEKFQNYATKGLSEKLTPVELNGVHINTPQDNFNAYYIFYHFWHHFLKEGVTIRPICDWTIFLHKKFGTLDSEYLQNILSDTKCMRAWQVFGCIVVDSLGLPEKEFPFFDASYRHKAAKLLKLIMNFHFRSSSSRPCNYWLGKLYAFLCHFLQISRVCTIFPREGFYNFWAIIVRGLRQIKMDKVK